MELALKALVKTMDTANPKGEKIELLVISKNNEGKVEGKSLSSTEIEKALVDAGFN